MFSQSDTLANGLPRLLVRRLDGWFSSWSRAGADVRPDSLRRGATGPHAFQGMPEAHAGPRVDDARTRVGLVGISPDSTRAIDYDIDVDLERDVDGRLELGRDVDSAPVLLDFACDSLWQVDFCGTVCEFDGAAWLDANRFALAGSTQTGPNLELGRAAFVDLYDVKSRTRTRWASGAVPDAEFLRFSALRDSALEARVAAVGEALPPGTTSHPRAFAAGTK